MQSQIESESNRAPETPDRTDAARRGFLTAVTSGAVLAGFAARARAQSATPAGSSANARSSLQPAGEVQFLLDRITNGHDAATSAHAEAIGYDAFLEEQLAWETIDDSVMNPLLAPLTTLTMTSKQIYDTYIVPNQNSVPVNELQTALILRGIYSKRQLFERMVEFWNDHFNTEHADGQVQWLKTADDRDVMRVHALGNFRSLLIASAKSAAMAYYLDNYRNFASAPNENYGREVMELHTLDVGNYTEVDVVEMSRCLTGWTYQPQSSATHGAFVFNAAQHDNGTKHLLGNTILPNGVVEGETALGILAAHPATAQFLARKLCRSFLTYAPPQAVVDQVANAFTASGGDIRATLRVVLSRATLIQIPPATRNKLKRPFHALCSVVRATNPTVTQPQRFIAELGNMGHRPYSWPAPNGYPDSAEYWGSSVLPRWNFYSRFFSNSIAGATVDVATLFAGVAKTALAQRASVILTGGRIAPEDVAAVQAYANALPTLNDTLRRDVLALTASSPSFQQY